MDWIDHQKKARKKKYKLNLNNSWVHLALWNLSLHARTVLRMQNKGNEIRWGRKALACHFRFNSLYSWLIWDVFNFEIFTVHAAAYLINSDSYILPWHIICSIKSFSWRTQHLAFVKWTIWRVCLTTPLQRTDKWFWFSGLKGQIHHFFFPFSGGNFHDMSLWETGRAERQGDAVMCLSGKRHGLEDWSSDAEFALLFVLDKQPPRASRLSAQARGGPLVEPPSSS